MELSSHFAFELQLFWLCFLCCTGIELVHFKILSSDKMWTLISSFDSVWMAVWAEQKQIWLACEITEKKEQNQNIKLVGDGASSLVKAYQTTKGSQSSCQFPKAVKSDNTDYDSDESWRKMIKQDLGENALVFSEDRRRNITLKWQDTFQSSQTSLFLFKWLISSHTGTLSHPADQITGVALG